MKASIVLSICIVLFAGQAMAAASPCADKFACDAKVLIEQLGE